MEDGAVIENIGTFEGGGLIKDMASEDTKAPPYLTILANFL